MDTENRLTHLKVVRLKDKNINKEKKVNTSVDTYQRILNLLDIYDAQQKSFCSNMEAEIREMESKYLEAVKTMEQVALRWQKQAEEMQVFAKKVKRSFQLLILMPLSIVLLGLIAAPILS